MAAEQLGQIFEVLEGGASVAESQIIQFPTDVAASSGGLASQGISTAVQMGNGAAAEVSQLTVIEGGASTTTGVGLLAMDVGVAGAAIAPALGILAGVGLYNLAPEFWTNVSNALINAGQTVGGKVRAFLDGNSKVAGFSEETIEIFKNAFMEAGLFNTDITAGISETIMQDVPQIYYDYALSSYKLNCGSVRGRNGTYHLSNAIIQEKLATVNNNEDTVYILSQAYPSSNYFYWTMISRKPFKYGTYDSRLAIVNGLELHSGDGAIVQLGSWNAPYSYGDGINIYDTPWGSPATPEGYDYGFQFIIQTLILYGHINGGDAPVQEGATLPDANPFPQTYNNWNPITIGDIKIYPTELPVNNPEAVQGQAQNPNPDPDPSPWLEWLLDNLPVPEPATEPEPAPDPDPDPQPEPDPIPEPVIDPAPPLPPDPNPEPVPSPEPIIPVLPSTVDSNAMFTVYAPSLSQLNSFGGWLWSSNIVEQILRMWQNPLDGIIALMKVYAVPVTGASRNIQVGYLDSGISAPVVTSQFVTVDCGTINVSENKHNATDYSPYTSLHLYLPFIGVVELDVDEFMNGAINVKYSIDMYTGTCLAEVKCTRIADMPNSTILYTFSGNASQQLPLTSSNFAGAISSLVSAVGGGIMVASGGAVGGIAGAAALGHSLTHEMIHVGHSGSLSSNAGIMAARTPYLIISRRHGYDANNYAEEYGYPANKAVYLGNCRGFTRIKAIHLRSKANDAEKEEINALLQKGVIL